MASAPLGKTKSPPCNIMVKLQSSYPLDVVYSPLLPNLIERSISQFPPTRVVMNNTLIWGLVLTVLGLCQLSIATSDVVHNLIVNADCLCSCLGRNGGKSCSGCSHFLMAWPPLRGTHPLGSSPVGLIWFCCSPFA